MEEIIVKLSPQESNYIERLFFEHNASLNIIRFLMSQEDVLDKHLQKYLDSAEAKYAELEIAKKEISARYAPKGISYSYGYRFDFDAECLIYWRQENEKKE